MNIKNKDLINVINFLDGLKVRGLKSVQRTNLTKELQEKVNTYIDTQEFLFMDYKLDENKTVLNRELLELSEQINEIEGFDKEIEVVKELIKPLVAEDSEYEFEGSDGLALQVLYYELGIDKE